MTNTLTTRIKAEILNQIRAGLIPSTVASFAELHDYCDANMFGWVEEEASGIDTPAWAEFCERLNVAQNEVDTWIKAGMPLDEVQNRERVLYDALTRYAAITLGVDKAMTEEMIANIDRMIAAY